MVWWQRQARRAALAASLARVLIKLRNPNCVDRIAIRSEMSCALDVGVVWGVRERGSESEPMPHALAAADLVALEPDAARCRC